MIAVVKQDLHTPRGIPTSATITIVEGALAEITALLFATITRDLKNKLPSAPNHVPGKAVVRLAR